MELSAAVVSTKLDKMSRNELTLPIENSFFWTDSDLATWLREFDPCSLANDWKEDKIKKFPTFLCGPKDAVKMLIGAMCLTAQRENFYAEFEARTLRPGEEGQDGSKDYCDKDYNAKDGRELQD